MAKRTRILLKLTGNVLLDEHRNPSNTLIKQLIKQLDTLRETHQFGIVIGGGNLFRGSQHGTALGLTPAIAHQMGMLATMMNGLTLRDLFDQHDVANRLLCAVPCPEVGAVVSHQNIVDALLQNKIIIFSGGTGNPFSTTDTASVLRALQMSAEAVWKGTNIDGIYSADPHVEKNAQKIATLSHEDALQQKLGIMDTTAYALAAQHNMPIRVFDIFAPNVLVQVAHDKTIGSTIA